MTLFETEYLKKQFTGHWQFIEMLARKRFSDENLVHEALLYITEKVEEDNWKRLRAFQGKSGLKTFLAVVVKRLLDDFSRARFGRVRPPEWLKSQGGIWLEIYRMLCLERLGADDVVENLTVSDPQRDEQDVNIIEEAIAVILSRITDCGKKSGEPLIADPVEIEKSRIVHPMLHHLTPEDYFDAYERVNLIEAISGIVTGVETSEIDIKLGDSVNDFRAKVNLSSEETLFLKVVYQEGLSVSEAGRMLGWSTHQASGKHRRVMKRIRGALKNSGLMEKVRDFLS